MGLGPGTGILCLPSRVPYLVNLSEMLMWSQSRCCEEFNVILVPVPGPVPLKFCLNKPYGGQSDVCFQLPSSSEKYMTQ